MNTLNRKINILLCGCALLAFAACEPRGPDADENEPESDLNAGEVATDSSELRKGLGGVNGDSDYCNNPAAPCDAIGPDNEGDCDSNAQCVGGTAPLCGKDNGAKFGTFANFDFCWQAHCTNGVQDLGETGIDCGGDCGACGFCTGMNGDSNFCTSSCQCADGQGDCDSDTQCSAGNLCGTNNGAFYGMPSNFDVCHPATCENRMLDGNETGIDCGGVCRNPCTAGSTFSITEIQSNPTGNDEAEWIEIYNPFSVPTSIASWTLNDWVATGEATNRWRFPAGAMVPPQTAIVVTRFNDRFFALFGRNANYELAVGTRNDPAVPNLTAVGGNTQIILADVATGDAVALRDPGGALISGVEYGTADRSIPGLPVARAAEGSSNHRINNTNSSATAFQVTTNEQPGVYPNL